MVAVVGLVFALVLVSPSRAFADVDGGCTGSADFSVDSVGAYTPANDTRGNPVIVPKADGNVASWEGTVPGENKNFGGEVEIRLGPVWIEVADWGLPDHDGSNDNDERSDNGEYDMDQVWDVVPKSIAQGIYEARASHSASGVDCQAQFFVKFEGSALSSPIVIGALVLLALFLTMLAMAARRTGKLSFFKGRPVLAVIAALLAAITLALILQQFSVWPLDNLTTIVLPIVMVVLGLLLAKLAPLGGTMPSPLGDLGDGPGGGDQEIFADGFESGDTSSWTDDS
jgi:uncharacterized membrane protein YhaH (DUF805 family)